MRKIYEIDGHTIEFGEGSSSLNPWSAEYCRQIGLGMMCTSDFVSYARIDDEKIYRLRSFNLRRSLLDALEDGSLKTWSELLFFYDDLFTDPHGNFSEMKASLDEAKRRDDEFKKLSPEEKKKEIERWRALRKAELEKERQEKDNANMTPRRSTWITDRMPLEKKFESDNLQGHREWTESERVLAWDSMYGPIVDCTRNGKWMSEQKGGYTGQICHGIIAWMPIPEFKEQ